MEPHSLVGGMGEGGWGGMGLACGLQDQRLMARPPARAGGRSGLLTGGESGKPNGYFLPSPKGHLPTFPARPAGGRAVTGLSLGGPQAGYPVRSTASPPHNPTREGSPEGRTSSLWGSFPHFFPRNGAPAGQARVPCRSNGGGENPQCPPPGQAPVPRRSNGAGKNRRKGDIPPKKPKDPRRRPWNHNPFPSPQNTSSWRPC